MLGPTARRSQPVIRQVFIGRGAGRSPTTTPFERKLYVIRKRVETRGPPARTSPRRRSFYVPSLSSRTIVYKGMLNCRPAAAVLSRPAATTGVESALALVHSRFSTNTFPSWARAHPYRYIAHNGEINTLRGNVNWMHARESMFAVASCSATTSRRCCPVIDTDGSDSAMFDNVLELLVLAGRSLPHAMMMMIPEPWSNHESHERRRSKAFYEYPRAA